MKTELKPKVQVNILDLATLLFHVHKGALHPNVGFEDCERTLKKLTDELAPKRLSVPLDSIESALWSCNLLDEQQEWWSPKNETFEEFYKRLLKFVDPGATLRFDRIYNTIRKNS